MLDAYGHPRSSRSIPTGPGSRGGRWHEPEYRATYHRAWRIAHPEYQERERLRRARKRARDQGEEPADTVLHSFPRPLPSLVLRCVCPHCRCRNEVPVVACGFCLSGMHA